MPLTPTTCSECGKDCPIGVQHVADVRGTWVLWRECFACNERLDRERKAEAQANDRRVVERLAELAKPKAKGRAA